MPKRRCACERNWPCRKRAERPGTRCTCVRNHACSVPACPDTSTAAEKLSKTCRRSKHVAMRGLTRHFSRSTLMRAIKKSALFERFTSIRLMRIRVEPHGVAAGHSGNALICYDLYPPYPDMLRLAPMSETACLIRQRTPCRKLKQDNPSSF